MIYYVSCQSEKGGWGTKERPFKTIGEAAVVAQAGDEVVVAPGVYREYVNPVRGGTDDAHRIIYRSQEPVGAVIIELAKILLKLVIKGTSTAFVGDFANFVIGCTLLVPASIVYHLKKTKTNAAAGLAVGTVVMAVFGTAFNAVYLLPAFSALYGMPLDAIIGMGTAINGNVNSVFTFVVFTVFPLNLIKGALVSVLTMLLYKRISLFLHNLAADGMSRRTVRRAQRP